MKSSPQFAKVFALAVVLLAFFGLFELTASPAALAQAAATPPLTPVIPKGGSNNCSQGAAITINDANTASPYPSTITVSGMGASIFDVNVSLVALTHSYMDDVDILLVGPQGQNVILMSDAGAGTHTPVTVSLLFDDDAPDFLPDTSAIPATAYRYKPSNYPPDDNFPSPAPALSDATTLATFNGTNPNGDWKLYIVDDAPRDEGSLVYWCLDITANPIIINDNDIAYPYPSTFMVSGLNTYITDVNVSLDRLTHSYPDDIDMLLVGPQGQSVMLMSDAGGGTDINEVNLLFDDSAPDVLPDETTFASGTYRPTNYGIDDRFTASASALATFNGTNPNGLWSLYVVDDTANDAGSLVGWYLNIQASSQPTATRTKTRTPTVTRTRTKTPTCTKTPTKTQTPTRTKTPTITKTSTRTKTRTPLPTRTPTRTATRTPTRTSTRTPTICPLTACTATPTRTKTRTLTRTPTRTPTPTASPSPTSDLPPATFFDENQLSDFTHPITEVSARTVYNHYRLLWNWNEIDPAYWWWDIFGKTADGSSFDADGFSFWDYIALYMNHEAEYHRTEFADDMSEAGVRFWYQRIKEGYVAAGDYGFVDWWASFSESTSKEAKPMSLAAEVPGVERTEYQAFIPVAESFRNPPLDWQDGQRQDRPYSWGNASVYREQSHNSKVIEMLEANKDKYPIIFRYIPDNHIPPNPMYVPSGCAAINWIDNSDANPGTAWNPNVCDFLLPTPTPGSQPEVTSMKKNNASLGILTSLCAIIMAGCAPSAPATLSTPSLPVISPTFSPAAAPTATVTQQPTLPWHTGCVAMSPSLTAMPDGVVVMQKSGSGDISLLDLQTGSPRSVGHDAGMMAISPDRRQLAYTYFLKGPLEIVDSSGMPVISQPVPQGWVGVVRWIDMDTLLMEKFAEQSDYYQTASSIIYNFKTGAQQELSPGYDKIGAEPAYPWGSYRYTRAVYDPSFSRVVYPGLILWDLNQNRSLMKLYQGLDATLSGGPQWSQDGSFFIAAVSPQVVNSFGTPHKNATDNLPYQGGYELWRVSRDGQTQRLTTLTTQYYAGEEAFSLSPDEKHIAFWLVPNYDFKPVTKAPKSLAILDMDSGEITDLCVPGGESSAVPVWSPDGKYLAVSRSAPDQTLDKSIFPDVLLIDLERRQAVRVAEDSVIMGWMVK